MTRRPVTAIIILSLAALLSVAGAGCSNMNKTPLESTAAALPPPPTALTPSLAPDDQTAFGPRIPDPVAGDWPPADFHLEPPPAALADPKSGPAAEPVSIVVSDTSVLPRTVGHVKTATFDAEVLQSDVPVLVDFYADWCGPCKKLAPLLDQLAYQTPDARIVKVNIDDSPELAIRYGVKGIPHLKVFKDGKAVAQHVGLANQQQLTALLSL